MMEPDLVDLQQVQVLSIDQIRSIRSYNNYVDRPITSTTQSNPSISQQHQKIEWTQERQDLHRSQSHHHHPHHSHQTPSSTVSSVSWSSTASEQRLLAGLTPSHSGPVIIRIQPKGEIKPEDLVKGVVDSPDLSRHLFICERCGKCKCEECSTPQTLPSCWLCGQRCLCSLENAVEYGTCLCCVKGIFYHCSSDDEDNCADQPCSCSQGQACSRWTTMGLLSVFLPCLCCYLPTKGCLKLCQRSYDRAKRPGCRCSNTNTVCRKISSSSGPTPFPKTLQKPV